MILHQVPYVAAGAGVSFHIVIWQPLCGVQAFWFFKYERDTSAAEDAAESGILHVSDGLRLNIPEDMAMATLLGLAIEAKEEYLIAQQQQPQRPVVRAESPQESGEQLTMEWPAGQCLGIGSTSQVYEAIVGGELAAVKMPVDSGSDTAGAIADSQERLEREIFVLTGPLQHLQGSAVPRVIAVASLADSSSPVLAVELLDPLSRRSVLSRQEQAAACEQLQAIHAAGVLHGDLRPSMILRSRQSCGNSSLRLSDFSHSMLSPSASQCDSELQRFRQMLENMSQQHGPVQPVGVVHQPSAWPHEPPYGAGGLATACTPSGKRVQHQRWQPPGPPPAKLGQSMRRAHHRACSLPQSLPSHGLGRILTRFH